MLLQNQKIIRYASENLSFDSAFSNEFIKEYSELRGKISEYEVSLEKIRYRIKGIKSDIESNVKLLSDTLELKVKKADTIKELNTEISLGKGIKLKGERLKVDTERFKVNESGVQFKGEVNATEHILNDVKFTLNNINVQLKNKGGQKDFQQVAKEGNTVSWKLNENYSPYEVENLHMVIRLLGRGAGLPVKIGQKIR